MRHFIVILLLIGVLPVAGCGKTKSKSGGDQSDKPSNADKPLVEQPKPGDRPKSGDKPNTQPTDPSASELAKFQGSWVMVEIQSENNRKMADDTRTYFWTVSGNKCTWRGKDQYRQEATISLNSSVNPKTFDLHFPDAVIPLLGVYELDGDSLKVCFAQQRPAGLDPTAVRGGLYQMFTRDAGRTTQPGPGPGPGPGLRPGPHPRPGSGPNPTTTTDAAGKELAKFKGTWSPVEGEVGGSKVPGRTLAGIQWIFDGGNTVNVKTSTAINTGTMTIAASANPKALDIVSPNGSTFCIYELNRDTLKICCSTTERPTSFSTMDTNSVYYLMKRTGK